MRVVAYRMPSTNPYAADLGDHDAITVLSETPAHLTTLIDGWLPADFERTYAPGKWHARQLLVHLLHVEIAFSWRLRMALSSQDYLVQPFEQDEWMHLEALVPAIEAWTAWRSLRAVNLRLARHLKAEQKAKVFTHPAFGSWTVATLIEWVAGHDRHHLPQFDKLAAR